MMLDLAKSRLHLFKVDAAMPLRRNILSAPSEEFPEISAPKAEIMPQRGSKKSRRGCAQCKRRRVKCDESVPCANCTRRTEECSLFHHTLPHDSSGGVVTVTTEDWLQDLGLMHHYSHSTSRSRLGTSVKFQHMWQECIPSEAAKHPFVMHGVLALSALHLACTQHQHAARYTSLCDKHQASALASYRQILTHITDDVVNALFALAMILSISSMARATLKASSTAEPQFIGVESICELLYLNRGVREIKETTGDMITNSPFSVALYGNQESADANNMSPEMLRMFQGLQYMVHETCTYPSQRRHCSEAIEHLQNVFGTILAKHLTGELEMGHIWCWTAMLSYEFIRMVQTSYPPSLVIVANFAVATLMLRETWYVSTWGSLAFSGIRLALRSELNAHLQWAEKQIASDLAGLKSEDGCAETMDIWRCTHSVAHSYVASPSR